MNLLTVICLISSLGLGSRDRRMNSTHTCISVMNVHMNAISGSLVKQQSNEHVTPVASAPVSEDKEDVISVSTLLAHTHFFTNTQTK